LLALFLLASPVVGLAKDILGEEPNVPYKERVIPDDEIKAPPSLEPEPVEDKKLSVEVETESLTEDYYLFRQEFQDPKTGLYLFRTEHQIHPDNSETNLLGIRVPIFTPASKGFIDIFGENRGEGSSGLGLAFDTNILERIILGGGFEQNTSEVEKSSLINIYAGLDLDFLRLIVGGAQVVDQQGPRDFVHGLGFGHIKNSRFIFGLGGSLNEDQQSLHFVAGQYPKQRGKGFGWRFHTTTNYKTTNVNLIAAFDANMSQKQFFVPFGMTESIHNKHLSRAENVMRYLRPGLALMDWTNHSLAVGFTGSFSEDTNDLYLDIGGAPFNLLYKAGVMQKNPLNHLKYEFNIDVLSGEHMHKFLYEMPGAIFFPAYVYDSKTKQHFFFAGIQKTL
jgi:hypothetical protein